MVVNYIGRHVIDNCTDIKYTACIEQVRSPYTKHAASGLPNPTQLEGEVRRVKRNFRPYNQRYTSPNEHFEYSYPLNQVCNSVVFVAG